MSHQCEHNHCYLRKCNLSPSFLRVETRGFALAKPGLFPTQLLQIPQQGRGKGREECGSCLVLQYPRVSQFYQEGVVKILKHSSHKISFHSPIRTHYSVLIQQTFMEGGPSQTSGHPSFKRQGGQQGGWLNSSRSCAMNAMGCEGGGCYGLNPFRIQMLKP